MKSKTISKMAGITVLITGIGHTATHIFLQFLPNPYPELEKAMAASKVNFGGDISVLDFQNGFSLTMGVLLIGLGIHIFRNMDKTGLLINLFVTSAITGISICYFPPFVIILLSLSFLMIIVSLLRYDNQ